ncbi:MAG TPA: Uma2 family endonuclease [Lacipirellulaceae bacterium]|nr:Uma2 family endonuclease [Lacipirellulaceae bacterium]
MSTVAHFSLAHYEHMVEVGAFAGDFEKRVELLRGEICHMSPIGFLHSHVVTLLTDWSYEVVPRAQMAIRVQSPIRIPRSDSEPEPDLVWVKRRPAASNHPEPSDVLLLIEVADSSLEVDRGAKQSIYAEAGIADYWIVNLLQQHVEVYRQPVGQAYQQQLVLTGQDAVRPLALPTASVEPIQLFRRD